MDTSSKIQEKFIYNLMSTGCSKSATLFSEFIDVPVWTSDKQSMSINSMDKFSYVHHSHGVLHVLTTELLGGLGGTSFLIFTEQEREIMLQEIKKWDLKNSTNNFIDSLLCEIANIISASHIAELSNALQIEVYGDVPVIQKLNSYGLQKLITQNFIEKEDVRTVNPTHFVMIANRFTIDSTIQIHPQLLWKLDALILEKIPVEKLS